MAGTIASLCVLADDAKVLEDWLADQFKKDRGWDQIAAELVMADGKKPEERRDNFLLAQDGSATQLASETARVFMGEFGRTPKVNNKAGRDHFPKAFSVLLAGSGIKGGRVVGSTNDQGTEVAARPVTVPDLFQTFCRALGLNPSTDLVTPQGRPIKIVDEGKPVNELFA